MSGILYGVGVGPGDPDLMTIKAARLIAAAHVIYYLTANGSESLARSIAAAHIRSNTLEIPVDMPMRPEPEHAAKIYDACASSIATRLDAGEDVVMLCEGDPLFYASFSYVLERLVGRHTVHVVPGVTSLTASAAALGMPLVQRNGVLKVLPATLPDDQLIAELQSFESVAIIKTGRHMARIAALLKIMGLDHNAFAVERATQPGERIMSLDKMVPGNISYFTTVIVQRKTNN